MNKRVEQPEQTSGGMGRFFVIVVCLALALALISFVPDDINFFAGGLSDGQYPKNLLGKLGAYLAWWLLLTFGFTAHVTTAIVFISAFRRLLFRKYVRPVGIIYYLTIVLFTISLSILLGTQPEQFPTMSARFNLAGMPGGVIGHRIGDPVSGWLHLILNTTGTVIVSSCCLAVSLFVFFLYDWQPLTALFCSRLRERSASHPDTDDPADDEEEEDHDVAAEPHHEASAPQSDSDSPLSFFRKSRTKTSEPETAPSTVRTVQPMTLPTPPQNVSPDKFQLPPVSLLNIVESKGQLSASAKEIQTNEDLLQQCLDSFGVEAEVVSSVPGPQVTLIKLSTSPGIKVETISRLENNIKMMLKATSLRILTPIPGENLVGVEVPNKILQPVSVRSLLEDPLWQSNKGILPILLGKNISGKTIIIDLAKAPHLLIAGATGAGKSVCMNVIIMSLLYKYSPEDLKLIMVDPKRVEFAAYQKLPHLLTPVIMDADKVAAALRWATNEMKRRLDILSKAGVRDLIAFNARKISADAPEILDNYNNPIPEKLPFIVIIIDELADIMATAKKDVETSLARLAAVARATGIHVIIATQRPDVKVITGTIKNNFPVRIAFRVTSYTDSMTILDGKGAENLLGKGDMLYKSSGIGFERIQGAMAEDEERNRVVDFISQQLPQNFEEGIFDSVTSSESEDEEGVSLDNSEEDSLYDRAVHIVVSEKKTSISYVQRRLGIGYNKAANLIEQMEKNGIVSAPDPSNRNNRELLITSEDDL